VYVTNGGFKYAWNLTNRQINRIGGLEGLGIRIAAGENDLVFGVRSPKPPLALRTIVGEGGTDVISTFIDPANANNLPEGWKLEREYVPIDRT
jgi:hypothetical protein